MKKQLMIVGIIVIFLTVGLSGCNENTSKSDEEKIIGTWTNRDLHDGSIESNSYIFYTNKTFKVIGSYESEVLNINGTWNITDNKLVMTAEGETKTADYKFSENNKTLTLTDKNGDSIKFIRE
jgi:uncharacterized protein (TIGR03066 family)